MIISTIKIINQIGNFFLAGVGALETGPAGA